VPLQETECVGAIGSDENGISFRFQNKPQGFAESDIGFDQENGLFRQIFRDHEPIPFRSNSAASLALPLLLFGGITLLRLPQGALSVFSKPVVLKNKTFLRPLWIAGRWNVRTHDRWERRTLCDGPGSHDCPAAHDGRD
jgi:hypothetical protein